MTINRQQFGELYEIIVEAMQDNDPGLVLRAVLGYLNIEVGNEKESTEEKHRKPRATF